MNLRLLACLGMGVFTTYMGLVMLIGHFRTPPRTEMPLPENFSARSEAVVDPVTGERTTYREITVSTNLGDPWRVQRPAKKAVKPVEAVKSEVSVALSPETRSTPTLPLDR
jgi:hypothetical protein